MRISTLLAACCLFALASPPAQADTGLPLTVTFQQPGTNATVNETLTIRVSISTSFDLAEVRAVVEDREVLMSTGTTSTGTLDLTGLTSGLKTVTVTVTDVLGTTATAQREFVLDRPPVATIVAPGPTSVSRGLVRLNVTCADPEGSCYIIATYRGVQVLQGSGAIQGTIDVTPDATGYTTMTVTVSDSRNQFITRNFTIYLDASLDWTEVVTLPGNIQDINQNSILYGGHSGTGIEQQVGIYDRHTGTRRDERLALHRRMADGFLTPTGALINAPNSANTDPLLYVIDPSGLHAFGPGASSMAASDHYATWRIAGSDLRLLNLDDGSSVVIENPHWSAGEVYPPSDEGVVVYHSSPTQSRIYFGGTDNAFAPMAVRTIRHDNGDVYYRSTDGTQLWVYDGEEHVLLTSGLTSQSDYDVNNGWVAYTRLGNLNQYHVWLIAPDRTERQITFFASRSYLLSVGATGEVAFRNGTTYYRSSPSGVLTDLHLAVAGTIRWIGDGWYRYVGSTLLRYDPLVVANEPEAPGITAERLTASPNPVTSGARVTFDLPRAATVRLTVIDVLGREVATLADGSYEAGTHTVAWEAAGIHDGVYTLLMQIPTATLTRPLTVAR